MKFSFWQERAQSQERQHKESLNREMQYRLALDNVVNMNHGDPASCLRCNYSKGDRFTYEEWLKLGAVIQKFVNA